MQYGFGKHLWDVSLESMSNYAQVQVFPKLYLWVADFLNVACHARRHLVLLGSDAHEIFPITTVG